MTGCVRPFRSATSESPNVAGQSTAPTTHEEIPVNHEILFQEAETTYSKTVFQADDLAA
ncbi:hypothetical protein [Mycobacterium szulgai]|uniref:hypothetical protein n=1 Tax=Mycobacterium szulgai TaxID=1787 RepID=UPI00146FBB80|nr:hypothetical protein [Mycobacterium szulgai]MCV7077230.1 hypothetical protein [Mycobacterium szulgai]